MRFDVEWERGEQITYISRKKKQPNTRKNRTYIRCWHSVAGGGRGEVDEGVVVVESQPEHFGQEISWPAEISEFQITDFSGLAEPRAQSIIPHLNLTTSNEIFTVCISLTCL